MLDVGRVVREHAAHIEHGNFSILLATFAIAYPILGGLSSLAGTLLAVILIQGVMLEGLRFIGEWRSLLFGVLIVVVMLVRPNGIINRALGLGVGNRKASAQKGATNGGSAGAASPTKSDRSPEAA